VSGRLVRRLGAWAAAAALTGACLPGEAAAQRRAPAPAAVAPPAPTPQLVTVRAREPLRFDAQVVVPQYYDPSFWPAVLAGLEVAPPAQPALRPAPAAAPALPGAPAARARPAKRVRPARRAPR
jgi:hypothetical protein